MVLDPGPSTAVTGEVRLGSTAVFQNALTIAVQVTWQCSGGSVATVGVEVEQESAFVTTQGVGRRVVVCDGQQHVSAVTVRAFVGTFQVGNASAIATLSALLDPQVAASDQKEIRIVLR